MEYLSDRLKDSFKGWTNGTCEFIDAETGCGKTTYILDYVLPFMTKNRKKILYLVNRKILKQQIEKELERKDSVQLGNIKIMTYQALETQIIENQLETWGNDQKIQNMHKYSEFDCVICDECHYFLSDSTYNANTYLSFIWIIENFYNRIRVYMSATIAEVELLVRRYNQNYYEKRTNIYRLNRNSKQELLDINECERRRVECRSKRNYGYLHIEKIDDMDDIYDLIKKGENEKWLIFVNNISEAKKLKNGITLSIFGKKNDVGRIDAKGDDDMVQIVDEISRDDIF
ncbi:MAG: DEAD/DEAH box helicase family protein [Lachnospiraceae bacterium]|nr:DEAD/DEAH box helicase family protein [Lachnospiraceae bacterium]